MLIQGLTGQQGLYINYTVLETKLHMCWHYIVQQVSNISPARGNRAPAESRWRPGVYRGTHHCAVMPPSIMRPAPVMNAASSEARKTMPLAISVGVPMRPIGSRSIT